MKIGILTFYSSINYGAFLQAYALSSELNSYDGINAEIIQLQTQEEIDYYRSFIKPRKNVFLWLHNIKRYNMFLKQRKLLNLSNQKFFTKSSTDISCEIDALGYDYLMTGSDEVWRIDGMRGYPSPYFLLGTYKSKKIAYAVSGRKRFQELPDFKLKEFVANLDTYQYIGVRDDATYSSLNELGNFKKILKKNLDPTFLYDFKPNAERGRKILAQNYHIDVKKKCIALMFSEIHPRKPILLNYLKSNLPDVQFISLYDWTNGCVNAPGITPFEWIDVIAAVDGVVTMYFHACCFSIITHTPFYAIEYRAHSNEESKLYDLLKNFDLLKYYSMGLNDAIESKRLINTINNVDNIVIDKTDIIQRNKYEFQKLVDMLLEGKD